MPTKKLNAIQQIFHTLRAEAAKYIHSFETYELPPPRRISKFVNHHPPGAEVDDHLAVLISVWQCVEELGFADLHALDNDLKLALVRLAVDGYERGWMQAADKYWLPNALDNLADDEEQEEKETRRRNARVLRILNDPKHPWHESFMQKYGEYRASRAFVADGRRTGFAEEEFA